jgi:hypothetical protein
MISDNGIREKEVVLGRYKKSFSIDPHKDKK